MWRGEPPTRATGALQAYVSNLRKLLGGVGILLHLLLVLAPVGNTIQSLFYPLPLLCLVFAAQSVFTGLLAEYVLARSLVTPTGKADA